MGDLEDILFSKFNNPKLFLKNRIVMNPVPTGFVLNGSIKSEVVKFYELRAKEVGLIIIGAININHKTATNNVDIPNMTDIEMWKRVTKAIHKENSKVIAEIWHSGSSRAFARNNLSQDVSTPSGVIKNRIVGKGLSVSEIEEIIKKFAETAKRVKEANFDGVDIHAAHGSLIHDFLTPETNFRNDEYGFGNRTYFAEKIIEECRKAVGEEFPILIRLSNFKSYDVSAKLANSIGELEKIVIPLSMAGVDIFDCSEINYMDQSINGRYGNLAYWIKKITKKPTITMGGLGSSGILYKDIPKMISVVTTHPNMSYLDLQKEKPHIMYTEKLVQDFYNGNFDLVAFGRPLLINENWVSEMKENLR